MTTNRSTDGSDIVTTSIAPWVIYAPPRDATTAGPRGSRASIRPSPFNEKGPRLHATAPTNLETLRRSRRYFPAIICIPCSTLIKWLFIVLS